MSISMLNRKQISVLLTVIALLLWSHSILYAKFEVGYFGLIHGLPISFFISLALLTAASAILWVSRESHGRLLCLQLLILISALWLVPAVTGGAAPFADHSYRNLGITDYLIGQGHFDPRDYLNWPGVFILSAIVTTISTINLESILNFVPLFMQLLCLLPLYVFLKNTLGQRRSNYCWAGAWLFYLARWVGDSQLTPVSVAFFLALISLALVTSPSLWEKGSKDLALLFLLVLTFAALTITHLPTSATTLGILAVFCLVKRSKRLALAVSLCFLLLVCWDLAATGYMTGKLGIHPILNVPAETVPAETDLLTISPSEIVERESLSFFTGSESHIAMAKIRLSFSAIFAVVGFTGAVLTCLTKANLVAAAPLLAIALAPLLMLPFSGNYDTLLGMRVYLYCLPGMAYFGARLLDIKKRAVLIILCLLLTTAIPLHIISQYGNAAFDYIPAGQTAGTHFFRDKVDDPLNRLIDELAVRANTRYKLFQSEQWSQGYIGDYIWMTSQDKAWADIILDDPLLMDENSRLLANNTDYIKVYCNPDFGFYIRYGIFTRL